VYLYKQKGVVQNHINLILFSP